MSRIMKVLLLLVVMVCVSKAQFHESGSQCLCQHLSRSTFSRSDIKDIQIYPATIFCDKVEILGEFIFRPNLPRAIHFNSVTMKNGGRYCLNPKLKAVKKLLSKIMKKQNSSTARPTNRSSATDSTNTAHI